MAFDGDFCSNHCSNASVCGWKVVVPIFTGKMGFASTSTGSPVSRSSWHVPGSPGNCQAGTRLLTKGSLKASDTSWLRAVMSWKPPLNTPGEIQLAKAKIQRDSLGLPLFVKNVWKPSTQHAPMPPVLFTEYRNVFGNKAMFIALVVNRPALIWFTTM